MKSITTNLNLLAKVQSKNVVYKILIFTFAFLIFTFHAFGQDDPPKDVSPAPVKTLHESEEKALKNETGIKSRTDLSVKLMEARLANAQEFIKKPSFQQALNELGSYQTLLEDALNFLKKNDSENGKVQNNFKKLEIILRKHTTQLELVRREMPYKFAWHVGKLMKAVRDARSEAIEPLYSDTIVKTNP